ncbi:MAG: FAD-dependent oxidoreductase [Deltaproteobacteria bacterium]|nr:FAD-dependent oxidoreductase [Deltaproteobacteria bacterium]
MSIGARSGALRRLTRLFRIGDDADTRGISSAEALDEAREQERAALSRRKFLGGVAAVSAFAVTRRAIAAPRPPAIDVGIVGAGLAGLQCAYELGRSGLTPSIYEAGTRVGGRQFSLRGLFPGQNAERGGELIDNLHKTMLGWVNTLGLTREDVTRVEGDIVYHFDGQRVPESTIVDEYRAFVATMQDDLRASTGAPTANAFNAADQTLDRTTLADYLTSRGCGHWARKALEEAYVAEYGRETSEQSALNFLLFIHADRRSKFTPFGVFSDERFHVVEGNDKIATGIAARMKRQPDFGMVLERVKKTSAGRIELTFRKGNQSIVRTHDKVVLALPFTVLRTVALDASLGLPAWKTLAINQLGYGDNAKQMIGFNGPVWAEQGCDGGTYSDLPNLQATWETNPTNATTARAVLTDYASGARGLRLDPTKVQLEADRFLTDLDKVLPGAKARATKVSGKYVAHIEQWSSNPLSRGSYTCYRPGQFTTIAENEGTAVGNLHFAGEHTNSFYEWQGFMEGALLSGIDAAAGVLG